MNRSVSIVTAGLALAALSRAVQAVSYDFSSSNPLIDSSVLVQGPDVANLNTRFTYNNAAGTLTAHYDSTAPTINLLFPLGQQFTQSTSFTMSTTFTIPSSGFNSPTEFGAAVPSFGLVNSVTTGNIRASTGYYDSDFNFVEVTPGNSYDLMTFDYFPTQDSTYGGNSINLTNVQSASAGLGFNNSFKFGYANATLPFDQTITVTLKYNAATQKASLSWGGGSLVADLTGTVFNTDSFAITLWNDSNISPPPPAEAFDDPVGGDTAFHSFNVQPISVLATWAASNGTGLWSADANWNSASLNTAGATANFDGAGTLTAVNVDSPQTVGTINFSGGVAYSLTGSSFTMDNTTGIGNASINSSSSATQTISSQVVTANSNLDVNSIGGGTLALSGGIDNTAGLVVTLNASGGSSLNVGPIANNGSLVVANNGGIVTVTGAITGSSGITQNGSTLILSSSGNNYAGDTTLNGGTLGGYGTITGAVVAGSGAHTIAPSATLTPTSTGTLTMGQLITNTNTTLSFNLLTPGTSDLIKVTGTNGLTLNGGTIQIANSGTGTAALGYYQIMQYSGSIGGTGISGLTLSVPSNALVYQLDITHNPGFIDIHEGFAGDIDDNGVVNVFDFNILAGNWQKTGQNWSTGDLNGDGVVNIFDFNILAGAWEQQFGGFGGGSNFDLSAFESTLGITQVPEPTSLALLGLGAVGLILRRRTARRRDFWPSQAFNASARRDDGLPLSRHSSFPGR